MAEADLCIAYLLWFLFGFFGVHRLYVNDVCGFLVYMVSTFFTFGGLNFFLWCLDFCLLPFLVSSYNSRQRANVTVVQQTSQQPNVTYVVQQAPQQQYQQPQQQYQQQPQQQYYQPQQQQYQQQPQQQQQQHIPYYPQQQQPPQVPGYPSEQRY
eukprot:gene12108-5600_t